MNIFDVEDAWTGGSLRFDEWKEQFEANWYGPLGKTMMAMWMKSLPPETLELLRSRHPEALGQLETFVAGKRGKNGSKV